MLILILINYVLIEPILKICYHIIFYSLCTVAGVLNAIPRLKRKVIEKITPSFYFKKVLKYTINS